MQDIPKVKTRKAKHNIPVVAPDFEEKRVRPKHLKTLSDLAAGDFFHYIDHYWPGGLSLFPMDRRMNLCDKYYPHAVGGPLWVDEEMNIETIDAKAKAEAMKKFGHRYLFITKKMTENDILEAIA
jgi:hypothetical protein